MCNSSANPSESSFGGRKAEPGFDVSIRKAKPGEDEEERHALEQLAAQLPGTLDRFALTDEEIAALRKATQTGPTAEPQVYSEDFSVVGVYRQETEEELKESRSRFQADYALILPEQTAADFYFREPGRREQGLDQP